MVCKKSLPFDSLNQIPFAKVLGHYQIPFRLKKSDKGDQLVADCPFKTHEKKETLHVSVELNLFRCPACKEEIGKNGGGNLITFVQAKENLPRDSHGYYQAAAKLAGFFSADPAGEPDDSPKPEPEAPKSEVVEKAPEAPEVKPLRPMQKLEIELREILKAPFPEKDFGAFIDRVVKQLKLKLYESYQNGFQAGQEKAKESTTHV